MKNLLLVLLGPTAVGKTQLSIELARVFGCDIISSDSRQFYREMRIGTAVPSEEELASVRHHFIHNLSVSDYYSSNIYEKEVLQLLSGLFETNSVALMAGGSGMYIDAVCNGTDDIPDVDQLIRDRYLEKLRNEGIESLRIELKRVDPEHYRSVDLRNPRRILRALEITASAGKPYSSFLTKRKRQRDFSVLKIGLNMPREELYERINLRVDKMIESGLEEEARSVYPLKGISALDSVGYREFFDYFEGNADLSETIRLIKRNSRRYAKRQLTWWLRDEEITWFHPNDSEKITAFIKERTGRAI